jgi:tRNA-dihydrouridine synthase 3
MLANRPVDISEGEEGAEWLKSEGCPFWKKNGYCQFGIMCRLGSGHINMSTGQNLCRTIDEAGNETIGLPTPISDSTTETSSSDDKPKPGAVLKHQVDVMNSLSKETTNLLRKNKYPFVCKRHFETKKASSSNNKGSEQVPAPPTVATATTPALPSKERKLIDFSNKVYIAPLTTVGNLPFRRIMKQYGADITCGEMALADQLLQGKPSEWALLKRHPSEDCFGVQIAAGHADQFTRVAEVLANEESIEIDFLDMNLGCPLDLICNKGAGACMMLREKKLRGSLEGMLKVLNCPVTIKMRTGWSEKEPIAHRLQQNIQKWGIDGIGAFMLHGRSRLQRYSRLANWDYITEVGCSQSSEFNQIPLIGNGDIYSFTDYEEKILKNVEKRDENGGVNNLVPCAMLGRGALIKPWLPTEIKERRHWDISASERLDMLKEFTRFGLEHWGSDQQGVNRTRRFLLEWLSFLHRYVPVGMLEVVPQQMNQRPPQIIGRSDLETKFLSKNCADWIKISEMLLGKVPSGFEFEPKHKANSYKS